ncbi:hypothetical protein ACFLYA_02135 [Candidatus Dependentiae bacterium]
MKNVKYFILLSLTLALTGNLSHAMKKMKKLKSPVFSRKIISNTAIKSCGYNSESDIADVFASPYHKILVVHLTETIVAKENDYKDYEDYDEEDCDEDDCDTLKIIDWSNNKKYKEIEIATADKIENIEVTFKKDSIEICYKTLDFNDDNDNGTENDQFISISSLLLTDPQNKLLDFPEAKDSDTNHECDTFKIKFSKKENAYHLCCKATGNIIKTFKNKPDTIPSVKLSPGGKYVGKRYFTAPKYPKYKSQLQIYDTKNRTTIFCADGLKYASWKFLSPSHFCFHSENELKIFDLEKTFQKNKNFLKILHESVDKNYVDVIIKTEKKLY